MFYKTVAGEAEAEFSEKRSRFIGQIKPVTSQEAALAFLAATKTRRWDANHNVFAYRLREGSISRFSDDGEPQGTAGIPVLEILNREELVDVVLVVTRYFGGTLLGAGGLVRAYARGAKAAAEAAGIVRMEERDVLELYCDYSFLGKLQKELALLGGTVLQTDYTEQIHILFSVSVALTAVLSKKLAELSGGQLSPRKIKSIFSKESSK